MIKPIIITTLAMSGCLSQQPYGAAAPTRQICKLAGFRQELSLAKDFRIDRPGNDAFASDDEFRASFAADAKAVATVTKCPNLDEVGVFHMVLHRIEAGSSRSIAGKIASWSVLLIATLGLSSIYPLTEERWLLVELDADATVGTNKVWSGQFTSFVKVPLMKEMPMAGSQLAALMLRAQDAAVKDLRATLEVQ